MASYFVQSTLPSRYGFCRGIVTHHSAAQAHRPCDLLQ